MLSTAGSIDIPLVSYRREELLMMSELGDQQEIPSRVPFTFFRFSCERT
jgi:hypothetical protein